MPSPLFGKLHLETTWTMQHLRRQVNIQGIFQWPVGEGRHTEPAQFGAGFLHGLPAMHELAAKDQDTFDAIPGPLRMDGHCQAAAG
jgi:hypothetical protein